MTSQKLSYLFFSLVLMLSSCSKEATNPDLIIDISDELIINMWEVLDPNLKQFQLAVETVQDQNCQNYQITHSLNDRPGLITVSLNELVEPADCDTGNAPASGTVDFGHLPNGIYNIEINLKNNDIINPGRLTVSNAKYDIKMESDYGIELGYDVLQRVPSTIVWGYFDINQSEQIDTIRQFFNESLASLTTAANSINGGEYGYFKAQDNGGIVMKTTEDQLTSETFILQLTGTVDQLQVAIDSVRTNFPDHLTLKAYLWNGREI